MISEMQSNKISLDDAITTCQINGKIITRLEAKKKTLYKVTCDSEA